MRHSSQQSSPGPAAGLADWLCWLEGLHTQAVDLGLDRLRPVARDLFPDGPPFRILTVAGTNGKGSSVALAEQLLIESDCPVGAYTSPHLLTFNERIRLDGQPVSDELIIAAFQRINSLRGPVTLSYFEFATLAALEIFRAQGVRHAVLEVGLGGRLDAVNVVDPDVALLTRVALDHMDWLGDDLAGIAREKAGICRGGRPAVVGDPDPESPLRAAAGAQQANLLCAGSEFCWREEGPAEWSWQGPNGLEIDQLPSQPWWQMAWQRDNAAAVLAAMSQFQPSVLEPARVRRALSDIRIPGRVQRLESEPETIVDVAHNPDAARALSAWLKAHPCPGRTRAVIGMKGDKDCAGVVRALSAEIDEWWPADLSSEGGQDSAALAAHLPTAISESANTAEPGGEPLSVWRAALEASGPNDRVLVLGSFLTVGPVLREWQQTRHTDV